MTDLTLNTTLTANAGPLNAALRTAEAGVAQVGAAATQANKAQADSAKGVTSAVEAQTAATKGLTAAQAADNAVRAAALSAMRAEQEAMRASRAAANNLTQAYRQLPAQMTDVFTSLASGMPLWLVAIQQGGQIKDSFGGIGNAARALVAAVNPVSVAVGGLAVGLGAVAIAAYNGAGELQAYQRAITLSGNAAGVTAGQLDAMAARMDALGGTQSAAAEALALLAEGGLVAAGSIERVGTAATAMERTLGIAVQESVSMFESLGRSPVQASEKLNERYNYLTKAVYEQIVALKEQGRTAEAAALAQNTFAETMLQRTAEVNGQLGSLQRGWRAVAGAAAEAWDAMLGIGRPETLEGQLAKVNQLLSNNRMRGFGDANPYGLGSVNANLEAQRSTINRDLLRAAEQAAASRAAAEETKKFIADLKERDKPKSTRARPERSEFVGPPEFDTMFPAANVREITAGRDVNRAAAVAERAGYEATDNLLRAQNNAAAQAARELLSSNRSTSIALIADARERGLAQIALEEEQLRSRLDLQSLNAEDQKRVSDELATWRVQRERQLTDDLKPEWQRMVDAWADTNRQMEESFDNTVTAGIRAGEDAWVRFAQTGKLSVRSLVDTIIAEQARQGYRQFIGQAASFLGGLFGAGMTVDTGGYGITPGSGGPALPTRGGAATGSNYIERDMLTILHKGEAVVPKAYNPAAGGRGMGGGAPSVTIINNTGTQATATAQQRGDGGLDIVLSAVKDSIAGDIAGGQGSVWGALKQRAGLRDTFNG